MMEGFVKYNFIELLKLRDGIEAKQREADAYAKALKEQATTLNKIISQNEQNSKDWVVFLPKALIRGTAMGTLEKTRTDKPKWKSIALEVFENFNIPMTSDLMYHKAAQLFEDLPPEKDISIKALSTALTYLYQKGEIFRQKIQGSREYIYARMEHFDFKGNLKTESFQTFKIESEGVI